jgi:hypothetical protein
MHDDLRVFDEATIGALQRKLLIMKLFPLKTSQSPVYLHSSHLALYDLAD